MINSMFDLLLTFLFSLSMLFLLRKVAKHPAIGLVDRPNDRKLHQGTVPLVGGLSICLSVVYYLYKTPALFPYIDLYVYSIIILVGIGVLDDKYDMCFKLRMGIQAVLALAVMHFTTSELADLGNVFGFGEIILPSLAAKVITILAVLGAINAFNMVDGIDGLLGGLASITFAGLGFLFWMHGMQNYAYLCLIFIVVMLPYILLNLGFLGRERKVFMGDAGSMLIGFTVIFLLIIGTQTTGNGEAVRSVTALWLIAIPLMDMAAIMYRRIKRGDSPFKPDREHLHHICQRIGLKQSHTLLFICTLSFIFALIGVLGELFNVPEWIMFYTFIIFFSAYACLLSRIWQVTKKLRSIKRLKRLNAFKSSHC